MRERERERERERVALYIRACGETATRLEFQVQSACAWPLSNIDYARVYGYLAWCVCRRRRRA